jgi:putative hydrolase of the HAD superfamily
MQEPTNNQAIDIHTNNVAGHPTIDVILFDIGGVLVELTGVSRLIEMIEEEISIEELWRRWLTSPSVRQFESGGCTPEEFARNLIAEMNLPAEPAQIIAEFVSWVRCLYPGIEELLAELSSRYTLACFSNTNELHWPLMRDEFGLGRMLHHCFVSHQIGLLKPDADAFRHVAEQLGVTPERILFLDDNIINVEGARSVGMHAVRVEGIDGIRTALGDLGLL